MTKVTAAVFSAIAAASNRQETVPELPGEWVVRAAGAVEQGDDTAVMDIAVELVEAHAGYRSSWNHWPWLESLREVTREARALRDAKQILGYGEAERAVKYFCTFAGGSVATAKVALGIIEALPE
ncbi:hypothetical protein HX798_22975 [Pseudomonas putida]|uniref:Uncharacterized protein n=1 Tax=Pseudomonas putida TaxID=303 RepID=A0A7Y7ZG71_PSEPU|nr:hypothetical protein [Pseudomonas putida]NWC83129.1 hypothetical protein [Pseudomonas putida]